MLRRPFLQWSLSVFVTSLIVLAWFVANVGAAAPMIDPQPSGVQDVGRIAQVDTSIPGFAVGPDGRIYLGGASYGSLYTYNPATGELVGKGQAVPGGTAINVLAKGLDGAIYGGTNNNAFLFAYSPSNDVISHPGQVFPYETDVLTLLPAKDGKVYGGTNPGARLFRYVPSTSSPNIEDLSVPVQGETGVSVLAQTNDGLIYGATTPLGILFSYDPVSSATHNLASLGGKALAAAAWGDTVYFGMDTGDVQAFSNATGLVALGKAVEGERKVLSLAIDKQGILFGGTYPGGWVFRYDPAGKRFSRYAQPVPEESGVYGLAVLSDETIYASTGPEGHLAKLLPPPPPDTIAPTSKAIASVSTNGNGWYTSDVVVTLGATDNVDGSGVQSIEYDDGSGWRTYTEPIVFSADGVSQLIYRATDNAGNVEPQNTLTLKIDKTPPSTTIAVGAPNLNSGALYVTSATQFSLSASDATSGVATSEYNVDNGSWLTYTSPFTVAVPDGLHAINYRSTDAAGNVEAQQSLAILVDSTPPETRDDVSTIWTNADVTVTLTATDAGAGVAATYYSIDGSDPTPSSASGTSFALNSEGSYTIKYFSVDNLGNAEAVKTVSNPVVIDRTPPSLSGSPAGSANANGWYNGDVTVNWVADDAVSGIDLTTMPADSVISSEGIGLTVSASVKDVAGNQTTATSSPPINVDKTPPTISGAPTTSPNANGWYSNDVTVTWTVSDTLSGIDPASVPADGIVTGEGNNLSASTSVDDKAGNVGSGTVNIKIDRTSPTLTVTGPATVLVNASATAVVTATDTVSGLDMDPSGTKVLDTSRPGDHTVTFRAVDKAGNVTDESFTYKVVYKIKVLHDPSKVWKSGSAIPLKIQLLDANGVNLSSPDVAAHVSGAWLAGAVDPNVAADSADDIPDIDFRYDPTLQGYVYNVNTKGYAQGSWKMLLSHADDSDSDVVSFAIR